MSDFEIHTTETAPEAAKPMLEGARQKLGFVPNLLGELAEAPAALQAYMAVSEAFSGSSLSPVEQQVVLLSVSFENRCDYCMAAHSTVAGMVNMPADVLAALRDGEPIADPKLEALRRTTRRLVEARGWLEPGEVQAFLDAGYGRAQLLEVIAGVAQKTISNYVNHVAGTPVDAAFEPQAWEHPAERAETASAC